MIERVSPYRVDITPSAERDMDRLAKPLFNRITVSIRSLAFEPRPYGCTKLKGNDEYRVRVGNHRVLYTIDDGQRVVRIVAVGHRRDVYRNL